MIYILIVELFYTFPITQEDHQLTMDIIVQPTDQLLFCPSFNLVLMVRKVLIVSYSLGLISIWSSWLGQTSHIYYLHGNELVFFSLLTMITYYFRVLCSSKK